MPSAAMTVKESNITEVTYRHLSNPRHKDHKVIMFDLAQIKDPIHRTEEYLCETHKEPLKLFCYTDNVAICVICAQYEEKHSEHKIKSIQLVLEKAEKEKGEFTKSAEEKLILVNSNIETLENMKESLQKQKMLFLQKLEADFKVIQHLVEQRHANMKELVILNFAKSIEENSRKLHAYCTIRDRVKYLKDFKIQNDIDVLKIVKQLSNNVKELDQNIEYNTVFDHDLSDSLFVHEPFIKLEQALKKYSFLPIKRFDVKRLQANFETSKVLSESHFNSELLSILPKIKSASLIYQRSVEGPGAKKFHEKCDNKGPTITLIKTADGHIFGGYNPTSWLSECIYIECEDAFLFSVTDGQGRKPIKFPIRSSKVDKAIKQNEEGYSPGFGEADNSDLFISYKNVKSSYGRIGNVYKLPKGLKGDIVLAGKANGWEIEEVEVFAVDVEDKTRSDYLLFSSNL